MPDTLDDLLIPLRRTLRVIVAELANVPLDNEAQFRAAMARAGERLRRLPVEDGQAAPSLKELDRWQALAHRLAVVPQKEPRRGSD